MKLNLGGDFLLSVVEIKVDQIEERVDPNAKIIHVLGPSFYAEVEIKGYFVDNAFTKKFTVSSIGDSLSVSSVIDTEVDEEKLDELLKKGEQTDKDTFDESVFSRKNSPGSDLFDAAIKNWIANNIAKVKKAGHSYPNQWVLVAKL